MADISIVVAVADNGVIGHANRLPWHIPEDLRRFKRLTFGHVVVMGRKTFESIGKPLPNRKNIVISRTAQANSAAVGWVAAGSLQEALQEAQGYGGEVFVIGGDSVYRQAMPLVQRLYVTHVHATVEGDSFFPEISGEEWEPVDSSGIMVCDRSGLRYSFATYNRRAKK
ncbi:MAG: dihydrofolate reductase [Prevotellaceae bacterium]|jgi:dihydrofolate reductase|nr:dihydrofolate reductase [Prevotellaceae bacterium]